MSQPQLRSFRSIAIIQTAFVGDVALALFLAQEIRALHPDVRLSFVCTPASQDLVRCSTAVDNVVVFRKRDSDAGLRGLLRCSRTLRELGTDCILALQRSARTALLTALCRAEFSVGFSNATLRSLYSKHVPWTMGLHETERNHSLLSVFTDTTESLIPDSIGLTAPDESMESVAPDIGSGYNRHRILIAPGSVWLTKRWTEQQYAELAVKLREAGKEVLLIGSQDDRELCERIAGSAAVRCLAGQCSFAQTLDLLRRSSLLVTNDSAPTHLAALVGTRTVTIYGSTVPGFGFAPRGENDVIVENTSLTCRPCGLHGRRRCPLGTMECMTSLSADHVFTIISAL